MLWQTLSAGVLGVVWKACNHGTLRKSRLKGTPNEYLVRTSHARLKYQVCMHWEKHRNNQISKWNKWVKWACLKIELRTFPISSVRTESDLSVNFEASPSVSVHVNRWNNKKFSSDIFLPPQLPYSFQCGKSLQCLQQTKTARCHCIQDLWWIPQKCKANSHENTQLFSMDWTLDIFMLFFCAS